MDKLCGEFDNRKKTTVFLAPPLTEPFELTVARAVDLKSDGCRIKVVCCNGTVKGCVANPFKLSSLCDHCINVREKSLSKYFDSKELLILDDYYHADDNHVSNMVGCLREDIWRGVVSTLLTFYRVDISASNNLDVLRKVLFKVMANNMQVYSMFVCNCVLNYCLNNNDEVLSFFNGRIVPTRAILSSAKKLGMDFVVIEVSGYGKPIFLAENASVHDLDYLIGRLDTYINDNLFNKKLGEKFFSNRRFGIETDAVSFTSNQKEGLCKHFSDKKVLSIFTSSPDEMEVAGDQWFTEASRNPVKFIRDLRQTLSTDIHMVVRMHPNQHGDRTGRTHVMINQLDDVNGIELIKPLNEISTYDLIDMSDFVLTFGSTVGLEAVYWGKSSILVGRALWENADVAYVTRNVYEVSKLIYGNIKPKKIENAIKVGSYYMDSKNSSESLSWGDGGRGGYFVNGENYLPHKRRSASYMVNRVLDKFLRLKR